MSFSALPTELILLISKHLSSLHLSSFKSTNRRLAWELSQPLLTFTTSSCRHGTAVLQLAALDGDRSLAEFVLSKSPDLSVSISGAEALTTPLAGPALSDATAALLGAGPQNHIFCTCCEKTALHHAAGLGHTAMIERLLSRGAMDTPHRSGDTSLHMAAANNHASATRALFLHSPCPTALHTAARHGAVAVLAILLDKLSCNVNALDGSGQTALHVAVAHGSTIAIRLLLSRSADPTLRDARGSIAADYAYELEPEGLRVRVLKMVEGVNIHHSDLRGETALHRAAREGCGKVLRALLRAGADVDAQTTDGATALHVAGSCEVVFELLQRGADDGLRMRDGRRAIDVAREKAVPGCKSGYDVFVGLGRE